MNARLEVLAIGEQHPAWHGLVEQDLWPAGAGDEPGPADERRLIHSGEPLPEWGAPLPPPSAPVVEHAVAYARRGWEIMPRLERRGNLIDALHGSPRTGLLGEDEPSAAGERLMVWESYGRGGGATTGPESRSLTTDPGVARRVRALFTPDTLTAGADEVARGSRELP